MNRLTADFNPYVQSPTQESSGRSPFLRARAQQLVRDNSHAAGFANELANQVIGPDGILLQAKVKTSTSDTLHKSTNDKIEGAWKEWGMPENATADGYESWVDFQRTVIRTIAIDGEVFIQKLRYFDNPFGFSLQIIDAELVDVERTTCRRRTAQNEIRLGIEVKVRAPGRVSRVDALPGDFNGKNARARAAFRPTRSFTSSCAIARIRCAASRGSRRCCST
jgi:capsid protein